MSVARAREDNSSDGMDVDPKRGEKRSRETHPTPPPHVPAPTVPAASSLALTVSSNQESTASSNQESNDVLMHGRLAVWNPDDFDELSIGLEVEEETEEGNDDGSL